MAKSRHELADKIRRSEKTRKPVDAPLKTDERVLARITDGIYRQPASALRELISNAYDADATQVLIFTDAPRFDEISIWDDGIGLTPEVFEHLIRHIGGSPKHTQEGKRLGVTSPSNQNKSPGGRLLIGNLGIGLFSVAQFTRHFLIITKVKGEAHRTVADITLGAISGEQKTVKNKRGIQIETGSARIWRESAPDKNSHGTEIRLLDLLPRTRAELASDDLWVKLDFEKENDDMPTAKPPIWHIGRMKPKQEDLLETQPRLPWDETDKPDERFTKMVKAVRDAADVGTEGVDLNVLFDNYLRTLWTLSLSPPLKYFERHPFDLSGADGLDFFQLENRLKGQAAPLTVKKGQTPRTTLGLDSPDGTKGNPFEVIVDGVRLLRPILYKDLPKTKTAVTTPLLFIGRDEQKFDKKPRALSGGPLKFEAYLFWSPRIVPKQHQGVMVRIGNAAGTLFDPTFMGYQTSEQTRTRQVTAEIFVSEGLEEAINIDRESFNYAHPHYQYIVKWLHSAFRQFANRHKGIGSSIRAQRLERQGKKVRERLDERVESLLSERGVKDIPEVVLVESTQNAELTKLRKEGTIALRKEFVLPASVAKHNTPAEIERRKIFETKAAALTQLLSGWGLLDDLDFADQEKLIHDILEIVSLDNP
jgi:hypothetical protein